LGDGDERSYKVRMGSLGQPPERIGRYRILRRLATGGLAEVYLGLQTGSDGFNKPVAIKRLHPHFAENQSFINMLADEARVTARLVHPNIAQVLEFAHEAETGIGFLVYEFVAGRTVSQTMRRNEDGGQIARGLPRPAPSVAEAMAITMGAARALDHASNRLDASGQPLNVVHRDISPPNIMVSFDGTVKVIDFGIAQARHRLEKTETGVLKGKFRYMSPEQVGGAELGHRSDLFALGCVFFEMLAGRPLFVAESDLALMAKVQEVDLSEFEDLLPDVSGELRSLLRSMLEKDAELRPYRGNDVADALARMLAESYGVYATEPLLSTLMAVRFPRVAEAIEQELAATLEESPPGTGETLAEPSNSHATATFASIDPGHFVGSESATVAQIAEEALTIVSPQQAPLDRSATYPMIAEASFVETWNPVQKILLVLLAGLVAGVTFLAVRSFAPPAPSAPLPSVGTPASSGPSPQHLLQVVCPADARVSVRPTEGGAGFGEQACPFAESVAPGRYTVRVSQTGYEALTRRVEVDQRVRLPLEGTLSLRRMTGGLIVAGVDERATVTVDKQPWHAGDPLLPGEHTVRVSAAGFIAQEHRVTVTAGESVELAIALVRPRRGRLRILAPKNGWFDVYWRGRKLCGVPPRCDGLTLPAGTQTLEFRGVGPARLRKVVVRPDQLTVVDLAR
jgi:serine/threonine-protein kinase